MPAHVEGFTFPHGSGRRIFNHPVLGWAFVATLVALIRRVARQPSLPRMSDQWLLSHQADFNRDQY